MLQLNNELQILQINLERETGIEPATNGLGSRYSTIELLPLHRNYNVHLSPEISPGCPIACP